ncbi:hypothetical protein F4823DRAFT_636475 [Ustulina deusta]|nr:hypothetical protein F4823DRAFT_636475 [Ustulina deusta]
MQSDSSPVDKNAQQRHEERVAQAKSIIREVQTLYDAGAPLFTKDAIRKLGDELSIFQQGASSGHQITLRGINGVDYSTFVDCPPVEYEPGKRYHIGGSTWRINYNSIQWLTVHRDLDFFIPETAYLPMGICDCVTEIGDAILEDGSPVPSTEEVLDVFRDRERQWKTSQHHEQLQAALSAVKTPLVLDKVIAVALGPLVVGSQIGDKSMVQHALISAIYSSLHQQGILLASSKRYVQDPAYTPLDKSVLSSVDLTVVDDPQAFLLLDDSSILVAIAPDIPVKQIVADICRPGIIIWDTDWDSDDPITDPPSPRVVKMIKEEYYELEFPDHEYFRDLVMYVKKPA